MTARYLSSEEVVERSAGTLTLATLRVWRRWFKKRRRGPAFIKTGMSGRKTILYPLGAVEEWERANSESTTSSGERRA